MKNTTADKSDSDNRRKPIALLLLTKQLPVGHIFVLDLKIIRWESKESAATTKAAAGISDERLFAKLS